MVTDWAEVQEPGAASREAGGLGGLAAVKVNQWHTKKFPKTAFRAPIATGRTSRSKPRFDAARVHRCLCGLSLNEWPVPTEHLNHRKGY
jgi:hypothetical protein